jgi:hypothetical protein
MIQYVTWDTKSSFQVIAILPYFLRSSVKIRVIDPDLFVSSSWVVIREPETEPQHAIAVYIRQESRQILDKLSQHEDESLLSPVVTRHQQRKSGVVILTRILPTKLKWVMD